ncbi:MAG: Gldg family protein [Bdellovibrionales bacterium]|nr:Gldg family protein [Bdellovibrionales bacterium]
MSKAFQVARKELASYFSSPVAFLFLLAFLAINLFTFFWVEKFFARNIADARPLFEWMPLLLIFLVGALTMRMWSEERRAGTVEFLLTLPLSSFQLILGKFLACIGLVVIALVLTLPIPITVSFLGDLDWGPVVAAYLATLFLAGAYASIGLYISSKTENQIVSLIGTVVACSVLYLIGSDALTPLVGNTGVEIFKLLGTGSRFESITRGVLDIRDIYYYFSVIGIFLSLNIFSLENLRWSVEGQGSSHRQWRTFTYLCVLNFLLANFWLNSVTTFRLDFTRNRAYSISETTKNYLHQLQEPLLIRGYFSDRTHPLLAPLVPQLRDLIREYQAVSDGRVRAEFVDPRENPELEEEASKKYGIKPVPFQISDRYEASLVNSYFDVLIQYGDKFEVLNFQDLIEVQFQGETDLNVQLRNPEYDLTKTIKKVLYGFQTTDNLFASLSSPVMFEGFISADDQLPQQLQDYKKVLNETLSEIADTSSGKLQVSIEDPQSGDGALATEIEQKYGFRPMAASLFSQNTFFFYSLLRDKDKAVLIPLPEDFSKEGAKRTIEAGLKRFSSGFLKTVGISVPAPAMPSNPFMPQNGKTFRMLRDHLSEGFTLKDVKLEQGTLPDDLDFLVVASPKELTEKAVFAIDQFLMKGGTVMFFAGSHTITRTQQSLTAEENKSGLSDWFKHNGITIEKGLVLDPQNEKYPVPMQRQIAPGVVIPELRMVTYPYFVDVRADGMNQDVMITSGIPQMTMNWTSPLSITLPEGAPLTEKFLLKSSPNSWRWDEPSIIPDFKAYPRLGFPERKINPSILAAMIEGQFTSYFEGKDSPLLAKETSSEENAKDTKDDEKEEKEVISGIITKSPDSGRIILFGSNEFVEDSTLQISASTGSNRFLNSLQLVQNAIEWSLEDRGLLAIRSRGHFSRTLRPLEKQEQLFWEYGNYALALIGLFLVFILYRGIRAQRNAHFQSILAGGAA